MGGRRGSILQGDLLDIQEVSKQPPDAGAVINTARCEASCLTAK